MKKNDIALFASICPGILGIAMLHARGKMLLVAFALILISFVLCYISLASETKRNEHTGRGFRHAQNKGLR